MKHLFSARHEVKAEDTETDKIQIPVIKEFAILCVGCASYIPQDLEMFVAQNR